MNLRYSKSFILLIIFLFLISLTSANVAVNKGDDSLSFCSCSEESDIIKIKNNGAEDNIYYISTNLAFVNANPSKFKLAAGATQDILLEINPDCNVFEKELKIRIRSDTGDDATIVKQLISGKCQNLKAGLYIEDSDVKLCESLDYKIQVENTATFDETYLFSSNFDEYAVYDFESLGLEAGQKGVMNVTLKLPCSIYGETEVKFFVEADKNDLVSSLTHELMIEEDFDYDILVDEELFVCEENADFVSLTIINKAAIANNYTLKLKNAPLFVKLNESNIALEASEIDSIDLLLNLEEAKNLGVYEFVLEAKSYYGEVIVTKEIVLNINDCYDFNIEIVDSENKVCSGAYEWIAKVSNFGTESEELVLTVIPEYVSLSDEKIILAAGEEKEIVLTLDLPDEDFTRDIILEANLLSQNITKFDSQKVKVLSQDSCYYVNIIDDEVVLRVDKDDYFYLTLVNNGLVEETYNLNLESDSWLSLEEDVVSLKPGEFVEVKVLSSHNADTPLWIYYFDLTISNEDSEYTHQISLLLKDKPICLKTYEYFNARPCMLATIVLLAGIFLFLVLLVVAKKKKGKLRTKPLFVLILIFLFVLAIFAVVIYYYKGLPHLNEPIDYSEASESYYIWAQDTVYNMPVSDLVEDPDMQDTLTLAALDNDNKSVYFEVVEGEILLTPEEAWYGFEELIIIASDSSGFSVESPAITLEVVKMDSYTLVSAYKKLCWYVNLVLLLICFVLLLSLACKRLRGKKKRS